MLKLLAKSVILTQYCVSSGSISCAAQHHVKFTSHTNTCNFEKMELQFDRGEN